MKKHLKLATGSNIRVVGISDQRLHVDIDPWTDAIVGRNLGRIVGSLDRKTSSGADLYLWFIALLFHCVHVCVC